ncbi:MAG: M20/M25/M40 family metallo-hydrolase [Pirellulales bacterium]|nr:M20/M25/M40 family metallo-hydrolase [Pirellulales bacterium]
MTLLPPHGMADSLVAEVRAALQPQRLRQTAVALVEVPSPTRQARAVADRLAELLQEDGFQVERPEAGWRESPAVACRYAAGLPGRTLQFNGHLDTVHLPFVPPRVDDGVLFGSGASDMKGGIAAAVEALRILRDTGLLRHGTVLLTAHDLHESPWGDGSQLDRLIDAGYVGDGVLLPEYLADRLPLAGRGMAVLRVRVSRPGEPVHEVLGGAEQPSVIAAGAELVRRLVALDGRLRAEAHPLAGRASVFIGRVASGEIYNQAPVEFVLEGTRRWLPGTAPAAVRDEFQRLLAEVAAASGTQIEGEFALGRDAFEIAPEDPLVQAFQAAYAAVCGAPLPVGAKPFVDDGNSFVSRGRVPAITHGPQALGAHTVNERVPLAELERIAVVYALTALAFCRAEQPA